MNRLNVGIIGAGTISKSHLGSYVKNPNVNICSICDTNYDTAKMRAEAYGIPNYYTDYKEILNDKSIDAVSIVTPTFTHKNIVIEALEAGKNVLCEKPPALNYEEALECEKAAKRTGKLLMYGFVLRFSNEVRFLKSYIDDGRMGDIYYADVSRLTRCYKIEGWFVDKEKAGGGPLIDSVVHDLDSALYLMGYPKAVSVKGFTTQLNNHLPDTLKSAGSAWNSADINKYNRNVESMASGYINFDNGACMYLKASWVLNIIDDCSKTVELAGTKAGVKYTYDSFDMVEVDDTGYYMKSSPVFPKNTNVFDEEINHFADCCINGTSCISTPEQGTEIMKIITAIYESSRTGKEIIF